MSLPFLLVAVLYAVSLLGYALWWASPKERQKTVAALTVLSFFVAWLIQGLGLGLGLSEAKGLFYPNDAFQLTAWAMAFSFLLLSVSARFFKVAGVFMLLVLLFLFLSYRYGDYFPLAPRSGLPAPWATLHLMFSSLGAAILTISTLIGTVYWIKAYGLKHKQWAVIRNTPPLDRLHRFFTLLLWIGFLCFTAGLFGGGGWSKMLYGVYLRNDAREFLTMLTWFAYAVLVNVQALPRWQGRAGMLLGYLAFLGLVASFALSHTLE